MLYDNAAIPPRVLSEAPTRCEKLRRGTFSAAFGAAAVGGGIRHVGSVRLPNAHWGSAPNGARVAGQVCILADF
jgi:hypothetical protein